MTQKEEVLVTLRTTLDSKGVERGSSASDKALKKMAGSFDKASKESGELEDAFDELAGEARQASRKVVDSVDNIGESLDKASKGKRLSSLVDGLGKIGLAGFAIKSGITAAAGIVSGFTSRIEAAATEIDTFNGLMAGIASSTNASTREIEAFTRVAEDLAVVAGVDTSEIASLISLFTNLGASQQEAARAVRASINIANTQGRDLERTAKAILDTYKGSREQAIELGINVKGLSREELLRGKALDQIERSLGTQLQLTTETTDETLKARQANIELNKALKEIHTISGPIRDLWAGFKTDAIEIGIRLINWANKILPDLRKSFNAFFTRLYSGIDLAIINAETLYLHLKRAAIEAATLTFADTTDIKAQIEALDIRRRALQELQKNPLTGNFGAGGSSLAKSLSDGVADAVEQLDSSRFSRYGDEDRREREALLKADRNMRKADRKTDRDARQQMMNDALRAEQMRFQEERRYRDSIGVGSILSDARGAVSATASGAELQGLLDQITGSLSGLSIDEAVSRSRGSGSDDLGAARFRHSLLTELSGVLEANKRMEALQKSEADRMKIEDEQRKVREERIATETAARQERFSALMAQVAEGITIVAQGASQTVGQDDIDDLRKTDPFGAAQAEFSNQEVAIASSAEVATKVGEAALAAINPALEQLAGPLLDLFLLKPDQVGTFFQNLANGFLIIIEQLANNVGPIIDQMAKHAPRVISALAGAAPKVILALLPHLPKIAFTFTTELLKALGKGLINIVNAMISGVEAAINKIPFVDVSLGRVRGGDVATPRLSAPDPAQFQPPEFKSPRIEPIRIARKPVEVRVANQGFDRFINDRLTIEGAQRTDNILTAAEAFNPYQDSGQARQRQPIALQIQIGNQRLRDILTDLDESGYNRVVTA